MIVTNREHALDYLGLNQNLDTALQYISKTDLDGIEDGNHLIEGEEVRVKVQHMQTKPLDAAKLEAHNDFADIQMLLEGEESIGWCFRTEKLKETEAAPERDIYFYEGEFAKLDLKPGQFVIVLPDDVHAPGLATDEPSGIRKAVFKVKLG